MKLHKHLLPFTWCYWAGVGLAVLVSQGQATAMQEGKTAAADRLSLVPSGKVTASVMFSTPKRYAIVVHGSEKLRRLYTAGEVMFHPYARTRSLLLQHVEAARIVVRGNHKGQVRSVQLGHAVPGLPGMTLVDTVMIKTLRYRFKLVEQVTHLGPVLLSITGSQALLEKEVLRLPRDLQKKVPIPASPGTPQRKLDADLLTKIRVEKVDEHTFVVDEATVMPIIENVGDVLSDLSTRITPTFSIQTGVALNMTSAAGDGVLDYSGLTVTRIGVAQTFGVQVGDTIVSLNGHPVNSPRTAWWTYQELFIRDRSLTELRVKIVRGESLITKTLQIR